MPAMAWPISATCCWSSIAGGYITAYGNNEALLVKKGDEVKKGQTIARAGATGGAASPRLHFEVRRGGAKTIDPMTVLSRRSSPSDDLSVHLVLRPAVLDLEDPDVGIVLDLAFDVGVGLGFGDGLGAGAAAPGRRRRSCVLAWV